MARWVKMNELPQRIRKSVRRRRYKAIWTLLGWVLLFLLAVFLILDLRLRPAILKTAEARATVVATRAINYAINEKIAGSIKYEDLYVVKTDARGKPVFLQPNTAEINRLASETTIEVQEALKSVTEERILIPLGQALGIKLLAALGPYLHVRIIPIGTVSASVINRFEQAGINQTWHKIYLAVEANMQIVAPLQSTPVLVRAEVPIAEGIILGEVPSVYLGLTGSVEKGGASNPGVGDALRSLTPLYP